MHKAIRIHRRHWLIRPALACGAKPSNVTLPQDKGPARSTSPAIRPAQQKAYKVFADKCAKCHTIARPINTTMTRPSGSAM